MVETTTFLTDCHNTINYTLPRVLVTRPAVIERAWVQIAELVSNGDIRIKQPSKTDPRGFETNKYTSWSNFRKVLKKMLADAHRLQPRKSDPDTRSHDEKDVTGVGDMMDELIATLEEMPALLPGVRFSLSDNVSCQALPFIQQMARTKKTLAPNISQSLDIPLE